MTPYTFDCLESLVIWLAKICAGHPEHYRLKMLFIAAMSRAQAEMENPRKAGLTVESA